MDLLRNIRILGESATCTCLNIEELLKRNSGVAWNLIDYDGIRTHIHLQWSLSKADTYGTGVFVRFREVSALERFEMKSSQI